jgi:Leucine-rich repeat (LRR) protein
LTSLNLGNNSLSGEIPVTFGQLKNLTMLFLSYNKLNGGIPSVLGSLDSLQYLYVGINNLTGTIPAELGNLDLQILSLDGNSLSGDIPESLEIARI